MRVRDFSISYAVLVGLCAACAAVNSGAGERTSPLTIAADRRVGSLHEIEAAIATANSAIGQLNQIEADIAEAEVQGDTNFFERVLADEFMFTSESGELATKAETIAALSQPRSFAPASSITDQVTMKFFGDAAIVWGRRTIEGGDKGGLPVEKQFRFTHVFQRWQGQWHMTACHQSRIARDTRDALNGSRPELAR